MPVFGSSRRPQPGSAPAITPSDQLSILAPGLRVVGAIESAGVLKIEGRLEGDVRGSTQVLIAPGGAVSGTVASEEVIVSGRVDGDITATERIEVTAGGIVRGDVSAPRIVVHEGGEVNGRFRMERVTRAPRVVPEDLLKSA